MRTARRASLVIRNLDPSSEEGPRVRARFARLGGVDLDLLPREPAREPPRFD